MSTLLSTLISSHSHLLKPLFRVRTLNQLVSYSVHCWDRVIPYSHVNHLFPIPDCLYSKHLSSSPPQSLGHFHPIANFIPVITYYPSQILRALLCPIIIPHPWSRYNWPTVSYFSSNVTQSFRSHQLPFLLVMKNSDSYRVVQYLHAINQIILIIHLMVPNTCILLSPILPATTHYSVLDVKDPFCFSSALSSQLLNLCLYRPRCFPDPAVYQDHFSTGIPGHPHKVSHFLVHDSLSFCLLCWLLAICRWSSL